MQAALENLELIRKFLNLSRSDFSGEPSSDIDTSWDELLVPINMRVTKPELERASVQSIALEGGG